MTYELRNVTHAAPAVFFSKHVNSIVHYNYTPYKQVGPSWRKRHEFLSAFCKTDKTQSYSNSTIGIWSNTMQLILPNATSLAVNYCFDKWNKMILKKVEPYSRRRIVRSIRHYRDRWKYDTRRWGQHTRRQENSGSWAADWALDDTHKQPCIINDWLIERLTESINQSIPSLTVAYVPT